MNDILKQRLVGALILVALGVIFWPIIFIQDDGADPVEPRSMPAPPGMSITPVEAPSDEGLRASPELSAPPENITEDTPGSFDAAPEQVGEPEPSPAPRHAPAGDPVSQPGAAFPGGTTRTEAPAKLELDSAGVPVAWTLQVATLSSAEKADDLRRRLLALEHKAYVTRAQRDGKTLYRVCVGPKFERAEIDALKTRIDSTFGVSAMVVRYVP